ncbi:MAG: DNA polymerase Y family protein [Pseudomonadales bacterium]|nr:DNA polymerase Y family protein [Pseudomonadales bacterium]
MITHIQLSLMKEDFSKSLLSVRASASRSLWLCVCLPALALEIYTRGLSAEEKAKPVVVLSKRRVQSLNQAALAAGIRPGNNLDTAYSLVQDILCFDRDEAREFAALENLAQWAYQFSPATAIRAPDCLIIEIGASLSLFGGRDTICQLIQTGLETRGFSARLATSKTPLAAMCLAQSGLEGHHASVAGALAPVAVTHLRIDTHITESLQQMGIETIGKLLELPLDGLTRRFGIYFSDYLQRLLGAKPDPQKYISPEPHFHTSMSFMSDISNVRGLIFPINRLLDELTEFLTARQLSTNQLCWKLLHRNQAPVSFSLYLARADNDRKAFLQLTQLKLEKLKGIREIDTISLTVNQFLASNSRTQDLFEGTRFRQQDGRDHETGMEAQADRLLNLLTNRLGHDACFRLSLANDHRPEKAWRLLKPGQTDTNRRAPASHDAVSNHKGKRPADAGSAPARPVFLLTPPKVLRSEGFTPCFRGRLTLLKGPERIDFGWWDHDTPLTARPRDYYIARHPGTGVLYWVFHYPRDGKWYLHGIFS